MDAYTPETARNPELYSAMRPCGRWGRRRVIAPEFAMSAFEGTPLAFALRDCGITAVAIAGIAMEIGIEPTARHAADLGIVPVVIADACGAGHPGAAQRSCEALAFAGDAIMTDTEAFCAALGRTGGS